MAGGMFILFRSSKFILHGFYCYTSR